MASDPEGYPYSSFGGYARKSRQVDWIAYEEHHRYWLGLNGGKNPSSSYRAFVKEGLSTSTDPQIQRFKDRVYGVDANGYREFRSPAGGRDLAAYLCRRYSGATLRELSIEFGLSHPDGSANLVRRAKARLKESAELRTQCQKIERKLGLKTEDQV